MALTVLYVPCSLVSRQAGEDFFFFFITLKPIDEGYTQSVSLKYEPASEPLHIFLK